MDFNIGHIQTNFNFVGVRTNLIKLARVFKKEYLMTAIQWAIDEEYKSDEEEPAETSDDDAQKPKPKKRGRPRKQ